MFEVAELGRKVSRKLFKQREPALREALLDAQFQLQQADFSVVIVIAGVEGAGKGETINLLHDWLDARGMETHAMSRPTDVERERPHFYRFWARLPPRGKIGIFFGSWYTAPIVAEVLGTHDSGEIERMYNEIADFERMLTQENVLVVKFWFHVSKEVQRERFEALQEDPEQGWRVAPQDWEFHQRYDEFRAVSERAIRRTSTGYGPWHIVEATDNLFRDLTVTETLLKRLQERLAQPKKDAVRPPMPQVEPVNIIRAMALSRVASKQEYLDELPRLQGRLGRFSRMLWARGRSVVLVFEGPDAAGKGGAIRRVTHMLDARHYRVISVAAPTDEEKARPYLWRFWRNVPRRGRVVIYDRSWYGRVLVERIEGFCSQRDYQRAYREINAFEEQLTDAGVIVLKFWLQIGKKEQFARFKGREQTGFKRHKLTDEDWRNRDKWDAYEAATCDMIARTSTEMAPWVLVEANDKRYARLKVLRTLIERLGRELGVPEDAAPEAETLEGHKDLDWM